MREPHRSRRTRVVVTAVAIVVVAAGAAVATRAITGDDSRAPGDQPALSAPAKKVGSTVRQDAEDFVAALRAGNRTAALGHGTGAVYDQLVHDEGDSTAHVRLQRCVRSAGRPAWTCGLDFPSAGPADGEAFAMTMTRSGSAWIATAAAAVAG